MHKFLAGGLYDANNVCGHTMSQHITLPETGWNICLDQPGPVHSIRQGSTAEALTANVHTGNCNIQFWGYNDTWLGENYGIPAGTYTPKVTALGYIQQTFDQVSVTLSGTPVQISNHLYRGVGFNITAYSIDWEQPRVNRNWLYPGNDIGVGIYDANTTSRVYSGMGEPATIRLVRAGNWQASIRA